MSFTDKPEHFWPVTLTEERAAWDAYAASAVVDYATSPDVVADYADALLAERRKRFGSADGGSK